MLIEREVYLEGKQYLVTISDEQKALRSAYAEGRAVIGLWDRNKEGQSLEPAEYLIEDIAQADEQLLERVVRRRFHLPWIIAETKHLIIREFVPEDAGQIPGDEVSGEDDQVFLEEESLRVYCSRYRFYEYGIWAIVEKESGLLVGKAGLSLFSLEDSQWVKERTKKEDIPLELGYHIFSLYRRRGYGREACEAILTYGSQHISNKIYARIRKDNRASLKLAEALGFRLIPPECSGLEPQLYLGVWCC